MSEIKRTADAEAGFVENVGVDLGGGDVGMTGKILKRSNVDSGFEQMGREAVPKRLGRSVFGDASGLESGFEWTLDDGLMFVTPTYRWP